MRGGLGAVREAIGLAQAEGGDRDRALLTGWASRRFVICSRPDAQTSAVARRLCEHLEAAAAG